MTLLAVTLSLFAVGLWTAFGPRLLIAYRVGPDYLTVLLFRVVPILTIRREEVVKACLSSDADGR